MSSLLRSPSRAESSQLVLKYVSKESGCGWVAGGGAGTLPWCLLELLLPSLPPSLLSFWICKRPCSSHLLMVLAPATGSRMFFLPHEGRPIVWLLGVRGVLVKVWFPAVPSPSPCRLFTIAQPQTRGIPQPWGQPWPWPRKMLFVSPCILLGACPPGGWWPI